MVQKYSFFFRWQNQKGKKGEWLTVKTLTVNHSSLEFKVYVYCGIVFLATLGVDEGRTERVFIASLVLIWILTVGNGKSVELYVCKAI